MKTNSPLKLQAHRISVPDCWMVHSYYSLCPYAPDGSGRILAAGADMDTQEGEVMVLSASGEVLDRFGRHPVTPSFWHTGFWQSWSPDGRYVYYQDGDEMETITVRRELSAGKEVRVAGELEGMPLSGEPGYSCAHSLLYAAGYGHAANLYCPESAVIPFQERRLHGIFGMTFDPPDSYLRMSTQSILDTHPSRERILAEDHALQDRLGKKEGLTLMTYCVRWNQQGTRFLFYYGNHCVDKRRGEPRLAYIFTADKELKEIYLALDISFERRGVHWAWQPDGERLIGYGPNPEGGKGCLAEVLYDGTGYRKISNHYSGGHPSVSPADDDLIVTDEWPAVGQRVVFISRASGEVIAGLHLPKFVGEREPPGRNSGRVCFHPVFSPDGRKVLCNHMPGRHSQLMEITL